MIDLLKNVYHSNDLPGEIVILPLKTYHNFFCQKITDTHSLAKIGWIITHIATGIFAYPIFSLFALMGVAISLCGIPTLHADNAEQLASLKQKASKASLGESSRSVSASTTIGGGCEMRVVKKFHLTNENFAAEFKAIEQAVQQCNRQMQKVYFNTSSTFHKGQGEATIELRARFPISKS